MQNNIFIWPTLINVNSDFAMILSLLITAFFSLRLCHCFSHPCDSDAAANSSLCQELRKMCLQDDSLSICERLEERTNLGIAILQPSIGQYLLHQSCSCLRKAKNVSDVSYTTDPSNFLTYLSNIPGDLVDFYTSFGFHVRRGFRTLQRNLQTNPILRWLKTRIKFYNFDMNNSVTLPPTFHETRMTRQCWMTPVHHTVSTTAGNTRTRTRVTPISSRIRMELIQSDSPPLHHWVHHWVHHWDLVLRRASWKTHFKYLEQQENTKLSMTSLILETLFYTLLNMITEQS